MAVSEVRQLSMKQIPLILASASPRRSALLAGCDLSFTVQVSDVEECREPGEGPVCYAERNARSKAAVVAARYPGALVIGADTIVVLGDDVLEKPEDPGEAVAMLRSLSGRSHYVITAVAFRSDAVDEVFSVRTEVRFNPLSGDEIERYVAGGEPMDKAGGYGIQGEGRKLVESFNGSFTNVVGLPVDEVVAKLRELGICRD